MYIKELFIGLVNTYTTEAWRAGFLWDEIERNYSHKKRHYHTLAHLDNLYGELAAVKENIANWDAVLFAMYYHDIVYDVLKKDNETRSAMQARAVLASIQFPLEGMSLVYDHIEATKAHELSRNNDTNLFTDADLSILGKDWPQYKIYTEQVRKEYSIYPDLMYKPGRKKVLEHFLSMEKIFKTEVFYYKYEVKARSNMRMEMEGL